MITLYEFPASGNCHKVRLFLSLLQLEHRRVAVQGGINEHKAAPFLTLNPFGQVPVLVEGTRVLRDSQAILWYLAARHGPDWLPEDAGDQAEVLGWLSVAANEVTRGPNALRLHYRFGRAVDVAAAEQVSAQLLAAMSLQLARRPWIAAERPTLADIALYPYLALAPEARLDLTPYPAVTGWLRRIQQLPGHVAMPGMLSLAP